MYKKPIHFLFHLLPATFFGVVVKMLEVGMAPEQLVEGKGVGGEPQEEENAEETNIKMVTCFCNGLLVLH